MKREKPMTLWLKIFIGTAALATFAGILAHARAAEAAEPAARPGIAAPQMSAVPATALNIDVFAECRNGAAVFRIVNVGDTWPKASTFAVHRLSDGVIVTRRSMRLGNGQSASFRLTDKMGATSGVGIMVLPTWYDRRAAYDAKVVCR